MRDDDPADERGRDEQHRQEQQPAAEEHGGEEAGPPASPSRSRRTPMNQRKAMPANGTMLSPSPTTPVQAGAAMRPASSGSAGIALRQQHEAGDQQDREQDSGDRRGARRLQMLGRIESVHRCRDPGRWRGSAQQGGEHEHVERADRQLDHGDRHAVAHECAEAHPLALRRADAHRRRCWPRRRSGWRCRPGWRRTSWR